MLARMFNVAFERVRVFFSQTLVNKSVTYSTRLETRTKESNMYASCRVKNLKAQ